jgi:hypothetical protein
MDHQKIYESLIQKAKSENRIRLKKTNANYIYYENHHILPKCLNGSDEKINLVLLTAREHFVCHKLLTYIYKGNRKIAMAFHRMTFNKNRNYNKSSRDYEYARQILKIPLSNETKNKMRNAHLGVPKSEEHINHMKGNKNCLGYKHTTIAKEKITKALQLRVGEKNPNFGKPAWNRGIHVSEESKQKNRQSHLGKIPWNKGLKLNTNKNICG